MRRLSLLGRASIGLLVVAGMLAATMDTSAPARAESKYARVTFHVANCLDNTGDVFNECHEWRAPDFGIWGCNPAGFCTFKVTDGNGEVFFGPRAGANRFFVDNLDGYVGTRVYCSAAPYSPYGRVLIDAWDADGDFTIETYPGENIICDLYLLIPA
ncbi:MAG TPA: hypothetical protein VIL01_09445 [Thermomicrobiales bacterium]